MKQIVVISGKGGTGKTVITASLAALARNKVMVDCDVDAADLHLLLRATIRERHEFRSGKTALIDRELCTRCGKCRDICRFNAITPDYTVESFSCEGCALCSYICPVKAIRMEENLAGEWFISETRHGPFVHAKLGIAEENSGKLVAKVRQAARDLAKKNNLDYVIIDGPPGIGCPVIASLTGVDQALIVTEPTLSGLHDAKRVIDVARHFNVSVSLVINKYDLNPEMTGQIENYCKEERIPVIGKIAFDKAVVEAMVAGKTIVEYSDSAIKSELIKIWEQLKEG
ncbi:(4Fe-4S)-binding protein [candidate division WOR-1 bacterium RIFOXYA12_FULL_52_29]|uniref:(4Fe-4S)-binding protein n=1 Tax=candidate division WOR-1 bacterium RIFOXYC12_FULL_54_18 TaxID=1802584 RepID=A0A1F4T5P4_UNCSA|nr:MAG: (4Fe-4S)-binding protein [candidate division WOR-1 bacterium RIFOXYA2_FULL_51_19]OGC17637.1 MAG: (4Fe-4S)-binding protein [candidate division WOR-1 bacterium RIFOXYA12_FULL_52_29]OGC26494.1 MAG: (4Fe-4S)-binding protein [candidate division WOR-1 bacterium RIFOXYB2_FULL_45_9]OGC28054.1 MAG: (4Fe-4S)-binding protein [candidate division WOR-1 bacterium RIFOXYC12_FULL_54_18]OGC29660.1 MAG: (4Fe-4S)-binding protein [candidate division WOR-1 bacterium RIFOXYB12_FULL_52_16]